MSVPTKGMTGFFAGMRAAGFHAQTDISMIDTSPGGKNPYKWDDVAKRHSITWLGLGIDSWAPFSPFRNWIDPLVACARRRDHRQTTVKKVYYWTLDDPDTMRRALATRLDGIITNYPGRLKNILNEEAYRYRFRLATLGDN